MMERRANVTQTSQLIATAKAEIRLGDAAVKIANVHRAKVDDFEKKANKADAEAEAHWVKAGKALFKLQQADSKAFPKIVKAQIGISLSKAYDFMKMPGVRPADYTPATGRRAKPMTLTDHRADVASRMQKSREFSATSGRDGKPADEAPSNVIEWSIGGKAGSHVNRILREASLQANAFESLLPKLHGSEKNSALHEARKIADRWAAIVASLTKRSA